MHASAARRAAAAASWAIKKPPPPPPPFLGSPTPPDFTAILPPKTVFDSAYSTGHLKCNRAEATAVLSEIWRATRDVQRDSDAVMTAAVSRICKCTFIYTPIISHDTTIYITIVYVDTKC